MSFDEPVRAKIDSGEMPLCSEFACALVGVREANRGLLDKRHGQHQQGHASSGPRTRMRFPRSCGSRSA